MASSTQANLSSSSTPIPSTQIPGSTDVNTTVVVPSSTTPGRNGTTPAPDSGGAAINSGGDSTSVGLIVGSALAACFCISVSVAVIAFLILRRRKTETEMRDVTISTRAREGSGSTANLKSSGSGAELNIDPVRTEHRLVSREEILAGRSRGSGGNGSPGGSMVTAPVARRDGSASSPAGSRRVNPKHHTRMPLGPGSSAYAAPILGPSTGSLAKTVTKRKVRRDSGTQYTSWEMSEISAGGGGGKKKSVVADSTQGKGESTEDVVYVSFNALEQGIVDSKD